MQLHKVLCEEHGAYRELTKKTLFDAIRTRNLMEVQRLVEQGADVNDTLSGYRFTPVSNAVKIGHMPIVRYLCEQGAR